MEAQSVLKCNNCGITEVDIDDARGDKVCVGCGAVLEENIASSEIQFEEKGGRSQLVGKFVPIDGGSSRHYGQLNVWQTAESHQKTLHNAKLEIAKLCEALKLNDSSTVEAAFSYYKTALTMGVTRGRKNTHVFAACVYIACRTKRKELLLIDISDVQQICAYELGRTYVQLAEKLHIKPPIIDPCLYVMRFARLLDFGAKSRDVSNTATRIVTRMMKDSMHSGRRPTGLCGAALLIAARMHEFNRTLPDIVRVVKVHESTLKKRLTEFSSTPSSALTVEEFMTVDLEQQQDPPAFKAAREKDKKRINQAGFMQEVNKVQEEIESLLNKELAPERSNKSPYMRLATASPTDLVEKAGPAEVLNFPKAKLTSIIDNTTKKVIRTAISESVTEKNKKEKRASVRDIPPDVMSMCRITQSDFEEIQMANKIDCKTEDGILEIDDLDDNELDNYLLSEAECHVKNELWTKLNSDYIQKQKEKAERAAREALSGKREKKKPARKRRNFGPVHNALEAMERILIEKNISSKINYDILRSLDKETNEQTSSAKVDDDVADQTEFETDKSTVTFAENELPTVSSQKRPKKSAVPPKAGIKRRKVFGLPVHVEATEAATDVAPADQEPSSEPKNDVGESDALDDSDDTEVEDNEESAETLYDQFQTVEDDDEYGYGYDDDNY